MSILTGKAFTSMVALLIAAALVPAASAASEMQVQFSAASNPSVPGARTIETFVNESPEIVDTGQVPLPATFATTSALAAGASFTDANYSFEVYLATPFGTATVTLGYFAPNETNVLTFHPIVAKTVDVEAVNRGAVDGLLDEPTGTPVDVGVARADLSPLTFSYPAGSYPAIKVEASLENDMFTHASLLGAADRSSATVPLPELTAGLLFLVGLATIGGFAVLRSRKEA